MTLDDYRESAVDVADDEPAPSAIDSGFYMEPSEHTQAEFDAAKTFTQILHERLTIEELEETLCHFCGERPKWEDSNYCSLGCKEADHYDNTTSGED